METSHEGVVHVSPEIQSKNDETGKAPDSLEKEGQLLADLAMIGGLGLGAISKEGIGFINEEDPMIVGSQIEFGGEAFLRLANVFGDDSGEINPGELTGKIFPKQCSRMSLARSRSSEKEAAKSRLENLTKNPIALDECFRLQANLQFHPSFHHESR